MRRIILISGPEKRVKIANMVCSIPRRVNGILSHFMMRSERFPKGLRSSALTFQGSQELEIINALAQLMSKANSSFLSNSNILTTFGTALVKREKMEKSRLSQSLAIWSLVNILRIRGEVIRMILSAWSKMTRAGGRSGQMARFIPKRGLSLRRAPADYLLKLIWNGQLSPIPMVAF